MSAPVVRTVTGDVDPAGVGVASMHEHVLVDGRVWYGVRRPEDARFRDLPVSAATLPDARWHAFSFLDAMVLDDAGLAAAELAAFAAAGGDLVVDLTCAGLGGRPGDLPAISRAAGVRIVLGAGFYVHPAHPDWLCGLPEEQVTEVVERQVAGPGPARPGVLGEIGMSAPPADCERRVLRAAARVAARYGMSVHVHTDNGGEHGADHVADCAAAGLDPARVVVGHLDERLDPAYHRRVLATGACIAFDTFGSELNYSGLFHHPSDRERMSALAGLVRDGWTDRVVLGHDVFVKPHLHRWGGYGYDHLPARVGPALVHDHGLDPEEVRRMLVDNPRRLLASRPPR